jgi:hypothetical protein
MAEHELKTWVDAFCAVKDGLKRAEFRRDDRGFKVRDTLLLKAWVPGDSMFSGYTGNALRVEVLHIVRGPAFGVPEGFVMMSISDPVEVRTPAEVASAT